MWFIKRYRALLGALIINLSLQFAGMTRWAFWHDESFTSILVQLPPGEMIFRTAGDVHPPLYYLLLHYWTVLFGNSDLAMRSLSAIAMSGALIALYFAIKRVFGSRVAGISALTLAVGPFLVRYGQEARMYGVAAFFIALATMLLVYYFTSTNQKRYWYLIGYAMSLAAAWLCHNFTFPLVAAHGLYAYHFYVGGWRFWPRSIVRFFKRGWGFLGAVALAIVFFSPWLPTLIKQTQGVQAGYWVPAVGKLSLFNTYLYYQINKDLVLIPTNSMVFWLMLVSFVIVAFVLFKTYRGLELVNRSHFLGLLLVAVLPPILIFLISLPPLRSVYVDRYFSYFVPAWYAALGVALGQLWQTKRLKLFWLLCSLQVLLFSYGLYNVYALGNYNYHRHEHYGGKAIFEVINAEAQPGDIIISSSFTTFFDARHYNRTDTNVLLYSPGYQHGVPSVVYGMTDILIDDYTDLAPASGTVWFISDSTDDKPPVPANWQPVGERLVFDHASVQRYLVENR